MLRCWRTVPVNSSATLRQEYELITDLGHRKIRSNNLIELAEAVHVEVLEEGVCHFQHHAALRQEYELITDLRHRKMRSNNLVELAEAVHVEVLEDSTSHLQRHAAAEI